MAISSGRSLARGLVLSFTALMPACAKTLPPVTTPPDSERAQKPVAESSTQAQATASLPRGTQFSGVVAVLPVNDHAASVAWYERWIGRSADVVPMEGVAEWKLAGNAWIQVAYDPTHAGGTTVVVSVMDVDAQRQACVAAGIDAGEVQDHDFVKLVEVADPDGNKVVFVETVQP